MRTTSPAAFTRATVVIAVKYSVVERPEKIDEILYPEISSFLMLIKDDDRVSLRFLVLDKLSVWVYAIFLFFPLLIVSLFSIVLCSRLVDCVVTDLL